jgi:hypothetical protein
MANYKAKKAGMTLAAQKKKEEKYDAEEKLGTPERIVTWMNATLGSEHIECPNAQWRKMQFWMRDGVALCKLINKLREAASLPPIKYQGNAHVPLVAQDNIDTFNKAAVEYGLPESSAFASLDLYEAHKGTFYNVVTCLNQLGFEANKKGFSPKYQYVERPTNDVHT